MSNDFYASDVCGVCQNWSGYGNPLCEDCSNKMNPIQSKELKPYPPTDLEEGTRPIRKDEYCADCGYQHGGYPGAGCGR